MSFDNKHLPNKQQQHSFPFKRQQQQWLQPFLLSKNKCSFY